MSKKASFIILVIAVVLLSIFLLWPSDSNKANEESFSEEMPQQTEENEQTEEPEDINIPVEEINYTGINGTYAHYFEEENKTVYVFFDEMQGMYIQEIMSMESGVSIKSAGNYRFYEDEGLLFIDNQKKEIQRDGQDLIIDDVRYERTQGILLTLN